MKKLITFLSAASILLASSSAFSAADSNAAIKSKLLNLGLEASKIIDSPMPGLKEVTTNRGIFYTSADGQFFIAGRLFDINNGMKNLTENAMNELRINGVESFKDSMIVYPAKNEKYKITVFTDTTCGYCRKLHGQMSEYNDLGITVQYLAFPRGGLNSRSFYDIQSVWCADDQQKAMTASKNGESVKPANCSAPISAHYELGQAAGVNGTPAIVLDDGTMIPGYKPPSDLIQLLAQ
ncbi:MAG: thiol:disulfide interchange protein DsbC [Psychrosphaera sp.]|jgi:thiol:disulfide interchange protein DsbC|uniref:Thiol:disulfide interchange protein n=1 Tax=Psychrosphaera aquimarina TaxID=2044854 RepID=A0ABU3R2P1_9GAMM|nr:MULTISPECIES: bifunctional protein-disulfide isomerase/oxidoreductase DsbC [Psychrosphaera]MBU2919220.1 bifunctional protein-disulfide isomerase/oxidoreductase DsbC [Psychrosphaera sp. F3M07]MDU0113940.1 bifunctional protein-disulfide isomerase/oxidoreductase DsbC [Psychrosphaera aquimarina]